MITESNTKLRKHITLNKYPVRTSAKAIIIEGNHILVIKHQQNSEIYFGLPGGGQNHNENLRSALQRECLEKIGAEIEIHDIAFVRDYIADNHEFAEQDPGFHQIELIFSCRILNTDSLHNQSEPDKHQIGIEWLAIKDIEKLPLYPKSIRKKILQHHHGQSEQVYLGDVN